MQFERDKSTGQIKSVIFETTDEVMALNDVVSTALFTVTRPGTLFDRLAPLWLRGFKFDHPINFSPHKRQLEHVRKLTEQALVNSEEGRIHETRLNLWRPQDANVAIGALRQLTENRRYVEDAERGLIDERPLILARTALDQLSETTSIVSAF